MQTLTKQKNLNDDVAVREKKKKKKKKKKNQPTDQPTNQPTNTHTYSPPPIPSNTNNVVISAAKHDDIVIRPSNVNVLKNLIYGGTAGIAGSLCTFPIDTSKTRLQEQVKSAHGRRVALQRRPVQVDWRLSAQNDPPRGSIAPYRGLPIQLIGIIPEKALKLSINDAMRWRLKNADGSIAVPYEMAAGATAGFCQVIVTSPMEMYKIRMQLQNKKPVELRQTATAVARDIVAGGLPSIYRGAVSTLLRDVTFSLIYFPMYSNLKLYMARQPTSHPFWGTFRRPNTDHIVDASARVNLAGAFFSGVLAGSSSAVLVTPADVLKTRLQSEGGKEKYKNIPTCARMTYAEDGVRAFFKGATGRAILIGPLFGIVLFTYEFLPIYVPL
jgi:hypothetical protein